MEKIIRENDAICKIEFIESATKEIIDKIDEIISKNYDVEYIMKIDTNNYKGDMGCLSVLGAENIDELKKNDFFKYLLKYDLYNPSTDEREDWVRYGRENK